MAEPSPASALRQLQQAQAGLRRAREALREARIAGRQSSAGQRALAIGWESLARTYGVFAVIPLSAATDDVLTKHLAVSRYATALLVRLRRLSRGETSHADDDEDESEP